MFYSLSHISPWIWSPRAPVRSDSSPQQIWHSRISLSLHRLILSLLVHFFFLLLFLLPVSNLVFFPVCLTSPLSPAFVSLWSAAKGKRQFGAADLKDDCMHFVYLHLWHALCYMWKLEVSCLILHFGAFSSYCKFKIQDGSAVLTWGNNISVRWAVIRYFLLFHRNLT